MKKVKLLDVCDVYQPKTIAAKSLKGGQYSVYGANGVIGYHSEYNHEESEVVMGCRGSCGLLHLTQPYSWINGNAMVVKPNGKTQIDKKFLLYALMSKNKNSIITGTANPQITRQNLKDFEIPICDIGEQERIVDYIETMLSKLDESVKILQKTKQQLAVYRQSVLKEAFEGNLSKQWRKDNFNAYEWKIVTIKDIMEKEKNALKAGPFGSSLKKEMYVPKGYKVYGQEQVIAGDETIGNYYIDESKYQELSSCKIASGDILISLVGTVGKVLILSSNCEKGIINPRLIKVTLDKQKMLQQFFKYYFESNYLKSLYKQKVHGATMDVLNMSMIKELPFPLCSLQEQNVIIHEIEARMSLCENIEKTVDSALQQAEALRQSVLKQAFEGGV